MPTGVLVISFTVHKKETEAYVNNGAIIRKCLYIIKENRLGGGREHRIRNAITQAEPEDEHGAMSHRWYSSSDC